MIVQVTVKEIFVFPIEIILSLTDCGQVIEVNDVQYSNTQDIFVTLFISKFIKSNVVNDSQDENMQPISVTLHVLQKNQEILLNIYKTRENISSLDNVSVSVLPLFQYNYMDANNLFL